MRIVTVDTWLLVIPVFITPSVCLGQIIRNSGDYQSSIPEKRRSQSQVSFGWKLKRLTLISILCHTLYYNLYKLSFYNETLTLAIHLN